MTASRILKALFSLFLLLALACSGQGETVDAQIAAEPQHDKVASPAPAAPAPRPVLQPAPKPILGPAEAWPNKTWTGERAQAWKEVDKLLGEQKVQAALKKIEDMLEGAKSKGDGEEQTRCLLSLTQMRTGLHGYETAVRFLLEQPWPEDLLSRTALNLYHAQGLILYAQRYSWEIQQRERIQSEGPIDLKAWTMQQIHAEANLALGRVWQQREQLGNLPTKALEAYLNVNNFPRDIRGSLRDTLVYLWSDLLNNTQGWSPAESNNLHQLDREALLAGRGLADPLLEGHPLARLSALLGEHERWHLGKRKLEAAAEARLELLRALHRHLSSEDDRRAVRARLEAMLPDIETLPWWAMAKHAQAQFVMAQTDAERMIRAHALATEGKNAFPESQGGKRCANLIQAIEQPAFQLSAMATDAPGKASLELSFKNLKRIHFRAYAYDLKAQLSKTKDYNLLPDYREVSAWMKSRGPRHSWHVDLHATPDFDMHRRIITPPKMKPGAWIIVASGREHFGEQDNQLQAVHMLVSDLVLVTQREGEILDAMVVSGSTGKPASGVKMVLYQTNWRKGHRPVEVRPSQADGHARFKLSRSQSHFVFASQGDQMALDPEYIYAWHRHKPRQVNDALLYTDRSIYRPGHEILFKAVAYEGRIDLGKLKTAPGRKLTVRLFDANHQEVDKLELVANDYGTASGSFRIPAGRALGSWSLRAFRTSQTLRVEEYKRPTFEAKLLAPEKALRLNTPAELKGEARYYFGLPVSDGQVSWQVRRDPIYPRWWSWWGGGLSPNSRSQVVATGTSRLDAEGKFVIRFTPEADSRLSKDKQMSYRYSVHADVSDEGGETRGADRSFRLGFVAVEANLQADKGFALAQTPSDWTIERRDLDGSPAPGQGAWRLLSVEQDSPCLLPAEQAQRNPGQSELEARYAHADDAKRRRPNPAYSPEAVMRSWADGKELAQGTLQHDTQGKARLQLKALPPGVYRLRYQTQDIYGSDYECQTEFVVGSRDLNLALPAILQVESTRVSVGETARVLAVSGLPDQVLFYEIHRDGAHIERRQLTAGEDPALLEIPVSAELRGGFTVMLWMVRDHQFVSMARSVFVPWDDQELKLEFSSFRDRLRPGQSEEWTVKVRRAKNKDASVPAAEILAYMYDRSLDSFAPHNPRSPLSLFPNRSAAAFAQSNLKEARRIWLNSRGFDHPMSVPALRPDSLKFFSGVALGGPGRGSGYGYGGGGLGSISTGALGQGMVGGEVGDAPLAAAEPEASRDSMKARPRAARGRTDGGGAKADLAPAKEMEAPRPSESSRDSAPAQEMRSNFAETAFWQPHLRTGPEGEARISFSVPDSVTSWSVWLHAVTRDMASGSLNKEARSVKELMVRPYLPRFLREGDQARLKVVVNNASERELRGELDFDIIDPETEKSLLGEFGLDPAQAQGKPFSVPAGGGANLEFAVETPARVGPIAIRVIARSGDFSDGELRPIPVLPGRMHLFQSRFVTLKDADRREMFFADLAKNDDASRIDEQMVVTLDGQLFYQVLGALPYLVNYPYECTEQTLNRFVSTGILSSMYAEYPAVAKMAKKLSARDTRTEAWKADDANRKMALEETPWLRTAKGGEDELGDLIKVLDPRIAAAQRQTSLARLRKLQTSNGAFPWFPGGPPSVYMTTYLLHGFAKAREFGVDVPKDMVRRAFNYLHSHFLREIVANMRRHNCCWEAVTFLNYVLSNYPDESWHGFSEAERKEMLDFSFKHWKQHAPYIKGQLALTLHRAGRAKQAKLVFDSVMDSAKTEQDRGTFWAPEDRAWLWYNDTIETHAFALRTLMEIDPKNEHSDGLVLWLLLNKKMNHWKSTRATAEVIYSLAHYLKATGALGVEEHIRVQAGDAERKYVFKPDEYTGKGNQWVIPAEEIVPEKTSKITVSKETKGVLFASATWHYSTEKMPEESRGDVLKVERHFFRRIKTADGANLEPLAEGAAISVGDELEVQLDIRAASPMEYVHLRDPRAAGTEPSSQRSSFRWNLGLGWYEEIRDSGTNFFFERLPQGQFTFKYRIRAAVAGKFKISPATLQGMYAPEFTAFSAGHELSIAQQSR